MKIAINTATYFGPAIIEMLEDKGFDVSDGQYAHGDGAYVLVNTTKKTFRDSNTDGGRTQYCPTTQWATIAALVNATNGGAQASAVNPTRYFDAVALPAAAGIIPVDAAGNPLAVGDTVLVVQPASSKPVFTLRTNGMAVITRITAKGALGFAFDEDNEFLSKRFQKVTLTAVNGFAHPASGNLVVARPGRHQSNADNAAKFALPTDTAFTFRGVTVDKGNFILDGYTDHQYSSSRFSVVTPLGA